MRLPMLYARGRRALEFKKITETKGGLREIQEGEERRSTRQIDGRVDRRPRCRQTVEIREK